MPRRAALLILGLFMLLPSTAQVRAQTDGDRQAIRAVIEAQIDAFQRDDGPGAFAFAAPSIQRQFGNPDNFMKMVRSGYPMVYRPQEVEFRDVMPNGARLVQTVFFVGPDNRPVLARYIMEQQADGSWRIAGVYITQAADRVS